MGARASFFLLPMEAISELLAAAAPRAWQERPTGVHVGFVEASDHLMAEDEAMDPDAREQLIAAYAQTLAWLAQVPPDGIGALVLRWD